MDSKDTLNAKAEELGRLLSQSPEVQALQRANLRVADERELNERLNRLAAIQRELLGALDRGEPPPEELKQEYETILSEVQRHPAYQALVAAQENFDRLMHRVNDGIGRGIDAGTKSRIILPT
jgi:cell fate (sporulation/competence/biofilm development) regulator YlbF (YheA/YmcA/DUF963 family)